MQHSYFILSFYHLVEIAHPEELVQEHFKFFEGRDVKSRIYISSQGINGQMSAKDTDAQAYMQYLENKPQFSGIEFKIQPHFEHVFPRLSVKVKKELVALGTLVSLQDRAEYLTPKEFRTMLDEKDENTVVLDIRNDYEWKLGHFEGAHLFRCATFKEFQKSVETLKNTMDLKKTKVLMYCTGGIRCELFSPLLKKEGFENLFQLHGGVIRYGEEEMSKHWLGKLFVFDDRLSVPISKEDAEPIGTCHHCKKTIERYYNCANMDCNELFLCCEECLKEYRGCCCTECVQAKRVRPFQMTHKPFRKWYHYAKTKEEFRNKHFLETSACQLKK